MQLVDLFSGIGGFSLSASWMGWRIVQFCEIDNYCQKILKKHWPDVPIHSDIKTLTIEQIINNGLYDEKETTIITAGIPCQPWSNAGKRQGEKDIRNLWPETIKFTKLFQPDFAVFENVPGLLTWNKGLFFENICTSLETAGYEIWPLIIPSASIGAWDKRDRIWIIAYNNKFRCDNEQKRSVKIIQDKIRINEITEQGRRKQQCRFGKSNFILANITESGVGKLSIQQWGQNKTENPDSDRKVEDNSDTDSINSNNAGFNTGTISQQQTTEIQFNQNIASIGRKNSIYGEKQERKTNECNYRFERNDWWERNWIEVASELCGSNARVSHRMERIKALGNSVNPYVVLMIFRTIADFNSQQNY